MRHLKVYASQHLGINALWGCKNSDFRLLGKCDAQEMEVMQTALLLDSRRT